MKLTQKVKEALKPLDKAFDALKGVQQKSSKAELEKVKMDIKATNDARKESIKDQKLASKIAKSFKGGSKNPLGNVMGMSKAKVVKNKDGSETYTANGYNNQVTLNHKKKELIVNKAHKTDPDYFDMAKAADKLGYKVKKG